MKFSVHLTENCVKHLATGVVVRFTPDRHHAQLLGKVANPEKIPANWTPLHVAYLLEHAHLAWARAQEDVLAARVMTGRWRSFGGLGPTKFNNKGDK